MGLIWSLKPHRLSGSSTATCTIQCMLSSGVLHTLEYAACRSVYKYSIECISVFVCVGLSGARRQLISHLSLLTVSPKGRAKRQPLRVRDSILITFFIKTIGSLGDQQPAAAQPYNWEDLILPGRETLSPRVRGADNGSTRTKEQIPGAKDKGLIIDQVFKKGVDI